MTLTSPQTPRYAYEHFEKALTDWEKKSNDPGVTRAIRKLKFMVLAYAWVDFDLWDNDCDKEQALSYAWEDTVVAFSGYGQSAMTGAVVDVWTATPTARWDALQSHLNKGLSEAEFQTPKTVSRRYLLKYRTKSVRTPHEGFDLPAVVPVWGPRLREWAQVNGMDPYEAETQMLLIEEYERMGLIDLGEEVRFAKESKVEPLVAPETPTPGKKKGRAHLTLVMPVPEEDEN